MSATATSSGATRKRMSSSARYWSLVRELATTNFKLKYTGSVLGYLWSLAKPLAYFAVLYVIFVQFFHQRSNDFPLQLLLGVVIFTFFGECTTAGLGSIAGNGHLIRKATFPLSALVIAASVTALFTFLINLVLVLVVALVAGKLHPTDGVLLAPLFLVELYLMALGVGMILASVFVFFRDLGHIWEVISQLLIYACGVVFPATAVPVAWRHLYFLNPLAQNIEDLRHALITPAAPWTVTLTGVSIYVVSISLALACFAIGLFLFRRLAPMFAENL